MKALQIRDAWGIDHMRLVEIAEPAPRTGEVKLRMKAASLNYRDLLVPERGHGARTGCATTRDRTRPSPPMARACQPGIGLRRVLFSGNST